MLRGTQKQIIHLKHTESPLFEEAFLIVKHMPSRGVTSRTLAEEANRLLTEQNKEAGPPPSPPRRARVVRWSILAFLLGAACGAAMLTLCLML